MITTAIILIFYNILSFVIGLFPTGSLNSAVSTAFTTLMSYLSIFNSFVSLSPVLQVIQAILGLEAALLLVKIGLFIYKRIKLAKNLLSDGGIILFTIDDYEIHTSRLIFDSIFGESNRLGTITIVHNPGGRSDDKFIATSHEYMLVYSNNSDRATINNLPFKEEQKESFKLKDSISKYKLQSFIRTGSNSRKEDRPNLYYPIYINKITLECSIEKVKGWEEVFPIDSEGNNRVWRWGKDTTKNNLSTEFVVKFSKNKYNIFSKKRLLEKAGEGYKPKTFWNEPKYNASSWGTILLQSILGKEYLVLSDQEMSEMHSFPEFEEKERKGKKDDEEKIKQNKEILKTLRDTHQSFIDILEIFCRDTKKPTKELNNAYVFLSNKIKKDIEKVGLKTLYYGIYFYKPFENDLYSAETEWNKQAKKLSWDEIRPALYKTHSSVTKLLNMSEEDMIMTDEEKKLEDITKLISEKRTEKEVSAKNKTEKTLKIEISKMPDLNVRSVENNTVVKNKKRITLPRFPRTEWSKVSITMLDDTNMLLSDDRETKPSSFEGIGCDDGRNGKPDENWAFLLGLAKDNGQTSPISKKERESKKKQKQKITDILRKIFQNETDPFETETGGIYKAKFNIQHNTETKAKMDSKYSDLEEVFSELTEPSQDDTE